MDLERVGPDLTVVTVCRNNTETISQTLQSVEAQASLFSGRLQHVLIEGCSDDNTWDIIEEYRDRVGEKIQVHAEQQTPKGIYPAMNRGLQIAEGVGTNFLNGDDFYPGEPILDEILQSLKKEDVQAVFGNINFVPVPGSRMVSRKLIPGEFKSPEQFLEWWMMPHQSFWAHTKKLQKLGFHEEYKIGADKEQQMRFVKELSPENIIYLNKVLAYMTEGGVSQRSIFQIRLDRARMLMQHSDDLGLVLYKILKLFIPNKVVRGVKFALGR